MRRLESSVTFLNRDEIKLNLQLEGNRIIQAEITSVACPECLEEIKKMKMNLRVHAGDFSKMPLPEGDHHSAILVRELISKSRSEWAFPYKDIELCHCRNVNTDIVDACIIGGIHRVSEIGEKTMAGTACGTCRPMTQMLIDYRLGDES